MNKAPVALIILDGWGEREPAPDNAIALAVPENIRAFQTHYPSTSLACSGLEVGLPGELMGNSEVGHLNMGAGRVVYQDITRISKSIEDGSFFCNTQLLAAIQHVQESGGTLHLMGLLSDGGVHSHMTHIFALLELARRKSLDRVYVHAFLDGRDVPPQSALKYIKQLEDYMQDAGLGAIATVGGRYWGMDRDQRWDRIEKAYRVITAGGPPYAVSASDAVRNAYARGVTDEFIEHTAIATEQGEPLGLIKDGDSVVFFNFRADRARQICRAFVLDGFNAFERGTPPQICLVCMTAYDITLPAVVAFPPQNLNRTLGQFLAEKGLKQLRIAETEKYAHLTFFFNGGIESPNLGEERILVPSPRVPTYDLQPEMSAPAIAGCFMQELEKGVFDIIMVNFANADMVGHTGIMDAAVQAVQTVDHWLGRMVNRVLELGGTAIITADHGNAEQMSDGSSPHTAHTTNRVPFILVSNRYRGRSLKSGGALKDVAPTVLEVMGLERPPEMSGESLII